MSRAARPRPAVPRIAAHRIENQEALVLDHDYLVRRIAYQFVRRLPPNIELGDLIQDGMVGLLEAARRYSRSDIAPFATFATFASHRIRGAMLDSLRDADWSPRSLRRRLREIEAAHRRIECATFRAATPPALAEALGVPLEHYHRTLRDANLAEVLSLDEPQARDLSGSPAEPVDEGPQPDQALEHEEAIRVLIGGMDTLSPLERTMLRLYYEEDCAMREIGLALKLSESRVCQIHKRVLERLRILTRGMLTPPIPDEEPAPPPRRSRAPPARAEFG